MDEYVTLVGEHQLLICKKCHHAVKPGSGVKSHFSQIHHVKGEVLKDIGDYIQTDLLQDPATAELPADGSERNPHLTEYEGYSCTACRYLTTSPKSIMQHWRNAKHCSDGPKYCAVRLQSWTPMKRARYWIISSPGVDSVLLSSALPRTAIETMIADSQAEMLEEDAKRNERGDKLEGIDFDSTWVKEMGWVKHFSERNKAEIHDAAQGIRAKKSDVREKAGAATAEGDAARRELQILTRLNESFDREVDRCTWRLDGVPKETKQYLHGIEPNKPNSVPFGMTAQDRSRGGYMSTGHRYLEFCWRAYQMGREEAAARLAMRFTDEQWSLMGDVALELEDKQLGELAGQTSSHEDSGFFNDDDDQDTDDYDDEIGEGERRQELADMQTKALDRSVFRFMVASIKVRVGGHLYGNTLLCFCAATGIKRHPLGFTEAYLYTGVLAALSWLARLFFLEACFEDVSIEQDSVSLEAIDRFQREHAAWMCVGTYTVMSKIINWMAYGKGHRNRTGGPPTVRWADDHEALVHNGERLMVRDFQRAACKVMRRADGLMNELMGGKWDRFGPELNMKRIVDGTSRLGAGQSFATNEKNTWLDVGPGKVLRSIETSIFDKRTCQWKRAGVRGWLRKLRVFREALMLLTHVWGGQPGRGPETTTMRHCDTWQLLRNVFVYDGQVMIATDRDKMKAIRGTGRKTARFLPDRIGRMMVAYIVWLLPAERTLRRKCKLPEPREECREFLWRNGDSSVWNTERLSSIMTRLLQPEIKMRLGVGRYRVMTIELGRRIQGLVIRQVDGMAGDEDEDDGIELDPTTGEPMDVRGSWNIVWDLQGTHSTKMARLHYAVHVGMPGRLTPHMLDNFRGISRLWHQFLMEGDEGQRGWKRKAADEETKWRRKRSKAAQAAAEKEEEEEREKHMADGLRMLMGPGSTWRPGKQRECMQKILALRGEQSAICVLPTGAGKSFLFMVPAVMKGGGTNVVVVPFAALKSDLVDKARRAGIDVVDFQPSVNAQRESLPRAGRMVVVSADTVSVPSLLGYLDGLEDDGLLQRIFIDEAHTAVTDTSYRVKLTELKGLTRYRRPMVLLTATMPVTLERWFRDETLSQAAECIRERTTKLNCRYEVEQIKPAPGAVDERVEKLVRKISATMMSGQKGVVYCRSRTQCEALAKAIGCDAHHGGMDKAARDAVRESWAEGGGHRWIVATSGLGTGIDVGGIVVVIHAEQPYGLVDFVQQTGRGARREGETVRSIIVHDGSAPFERAGMSPVERMNKHQMEVFMKSPGCRREVLGSFMDRVMGEVCADIEGAIPCDHCQPPEKVDSNGEEEGEQIDEETDVDGVIDGPREGIWRAYNQCEGEKVDVVTRWLDEVQDTCAICHVRSCLRTAAGQAVPLAHRHETAWGICEPVKGESYDSIRKKIRFAENSCCFRCKLPSDWCKETKESAGEGEGCMYMDKVLPVALLPMGQARMKEWVMQKFEVDVDDRTAWFKWLAGQVQFHGTNGTNMHMLWEAIVYRVYQKHMGL